MKTLLTAISRFFASIVDFILGRKYDIPDFEEKSATSIYEKLNQLKEEASQNDEILEFCREIEDILYLLQARSSIEPGAFLNFCERIFEGGIDIYSVESMLWEVNRPPDKDTVNRKAYELSQFFSYLERRVNAFLPQYHRKQEIKSVMEQLSALQAKEASQETLNFCRDATELIPLLNDNEKIPSEKLREFMRNHAPHSPLYYELEILLHAPDPKEMREIDAFPRIFFIRKLIGKMVNEWSSLLSYDPIPLPDLSQQAPIGTEAGEINKGKIALLKLSIAKDQENVALTEMIRISHSLPELHKEAVLLRQCALMLSREALRGSSSNSRINKLNWLRTSWFLDVLSRMEERAEL